ncbi:hypothetical protein BHM03_00006680 [Ensete ventricosum]|nr:hypothetical protein BHM03_00006680 [Ensete ventricosum]
MEISPAVPEDDDFEEHSPSGRHGFGSLGAEEDRSLAIKGFLRRHAMEAQNSFPKSLGGDPQITTDDNGVVLFLAS